MHVLLNYRKSRYELSKERGGSVMDRPENLREHRLLHETLESTLRELERRGWSCEPHYRADLAGLAISPEQYDLLLSVGGDGTHLEASHVANGTPLLGINPNPLKSFGLFSGATAESLPAMLDRIEAGERPFALTRGAVTHTPRGGEPRTLPERILNDAFFSHSKPSASTWCNLVLDGVEYSFANSGLLIYTGAGSSAWARSMGGFLFDMDEQALAFHSREPLNVVKADNPVRRGLVYADQLMLISRTHSAEVALDGSHCICPVGFDDVLLFSRAEPALLYGLSNERRITRFPEYAAVSAERRAQASVYR